MIRAIKRLRLPADLLGERPPGKVFQREIRQPFMFPDLEDPHEIGMLDRRHSFRFGLEPQNILGPVPDPARIISERDKPIAPRLPRLVDDPYAPHPEHLQDLVTGDLRLGHPHWPGPGRQRPLQILRRPHRD